MSEVGESASDRLHRIWSKDKFRFAFQHRGGLCSSIWSIWERNDTVYLANRNVGKNLKISLHPQGGYRLAITSEHFRQLQQLGKAPDTRTMTVWNRPDPPDLGAKLVLSIEYPSQHFQNPEPSGTPKKPLVIFGTTLEGAAAQLGVFISREPKDTLEPKLAELGTPLIGWDFSDGSSLTVLAREIVFDGSSLPSSPVTVSAGKEAPPKSRDLTALFWNTPISDQPLRLIEIGGVSVRASGQ